MPLVEVIRGKQSSEVAMATVAAFARKLGKTVVICNDGPGFVVNRILAPYMNEAALLLEEGWSIDSLDQAMLDFGMPMGPFALLDEVGIDVAAKVAVIMTERLAGRGGERVAKRAEVVEKLYKDGRLGKKGGRGVYTYKDGAPASAGGKRGGVDPTVYKLLGISNPRPVDPKVAVERMIFSMVNEAALILEERIVGSAPELDLAMIMGTGFPPFRGGLLRYADSLGLPYILARLNDFETRIGPRFVATPPLRRLAERDGKFYEAYPRL
jgi:3-hydroxyacyl-CoA dehydrogenase/enoyl-CoA hydratase/3-hydroxybutyryl-CoA epimerase